MIKVALVSKWFYYNKNSLLEIDMDKLKRIIRHPEKIYVDEADDGWLHSFEVTESDGTKNIIEMR